MGATGRRAVKTSVTTEMPPPKVPMSCRFGRTAIGNNAVGIFIDGEKEPLFETVVIGELTEKRKDEIAEACFALANACWGDVSNFRRMRDMQ